MTMAGLARIARLFAFLLHAIACLAWLFVMPGGFPLFHWRSLANGALPLAVLVLALAGIYAARTGRKGLLHAITTCMAAAWLAASGAGFVLFPISARFLFPAGLVVSCVLCLARMGCADRPSRRQWLTLNLTFLGVVMGALFPFTQRAAGPGTHPFGSAYLEEPPTKWAETAPEVAQMNSLRVFSSSGHSVFTRGRWSLSIDPMLTFVSRSPDRC